MLDDSTDESVSITAAKIQEYKDKGFWIEHVRRADRKGYKAGALAEGLKNRRVMLRDFYWSAHFLPHPDFLVRTVPYFLANERTGVVQTRWEHLNKDYSLLTRIQAMQLDVHFTVEQMGRSSGDCLLQFNGTGGVCGAAPRLMMPVVGSRYAHRRP